VNFSLNFSFFSKTLVLAVPHAPLVLKNNTCRSVGPLPPPWARSMEVARWCYRDRWLSGALATPGGTLSYSNDRAPLTRRQWRSSPPIPHHRHRVKLGTGGANGGGARAPPALTPTVGIDRSKLLVPYDANVCFRCFSRFKGMLQLFLMDVAKVDRRMLHMLHLFQKHVASVCSKCFICFQTYVCNRFLFGYCICFHTCYNSIF
jgi:hypothetical protein